MKKKSTRIYFSTYIVYYYYLYYLSDNVKALFRRGKAHIKVWNLQQAKEDLEKVLLLDKNEKSSVMSLMAEIKKAEIESKNSDKALMKKKYFNLFKIKTLLLIFYICS